MKRFCKYLLIKLKNDTDVKQLDKIKNVMHLIFQEDFDNYGNMACTKCILRVSECDYDTMSGSLPEK